MAIRTTAMRVGLVCLVGAAAVAMWLASRQADRGQALVLAEVIPADARAVVWFDGLAALLADLDRLSTHLPGADNIPAVVALSLGVAQPTAAAVDSAGLVAASGGALFVWQDAVWGVIAVHPERGLSHVRTWLEQRGFNLHVLSAPNAWRVTNGEQTAETIAYVWLRGDRLLARALLPNRWVAALGSTAALGTTTKTGATEASSPSVLPPPADLLQQYEAAKKSLTSTSSTGLHARLHLGPGDKVRPAMRRALGLATLLFGGLIDGIQGLKADLLMDAEQLNLALQLPSAPGANADIATYHDGFLPKSAAPLQLGAVLPDEVALWGRIHLNPRLLDMIPSFVRNRVLPPTLLSRLHPALRTVDARALVFDQLEGRIAVGILGIDDQAGLDPRQWRRTGLQRVLSGFAAVSFRSNAAALALHTAVEKALVTAGEKLAPMTLGQWRGWSLSTADTEVSLLRRDNALLLISGRGERARFERVTRKRFPSLGQAAATPLEKAMVADKIGWIGLGVTTGRIARAARRRGVPDAFVRMVRAVAAITVGVQLDANGLAIQAQLRPRLRRKP